MTHDQYKAHTATGKDLDRIGEHLGVKRYAAMTGYPTVHHPETDARYRERMIQTLWPTSKEDKAYPFTADKNMRTERVYPPFTALKGMRTYDPSKCVMYLNGEPIDPFFASRVYQDEAQRARSGTVTVTLTPVKKEKNDMSKLKWTVTNANNRPIVSCYPAEDLSDGERSEPRVQFHAENMASMYPADWKELRTMVDELFAEYK